MWINDSIIMEKTIHSILIWMLNTIHQKWQVLHLVSQPAFLDCMFRRLGKKNAIRRYIDLVNDCVKNAKLDFFFWFKCCNTYRLELAKLLYQLPNTFMLMKFCAWANLQNPQFQEYNNDFDLLIRNHKSTWLGWIDVAVLYLIEERNSKYNNA
jgi:hypothetical protein